MTGGRMQRAFLILGFVLYVVVSGVMARYALG